MHFSLKFLTHLWLPLQNQLKMFFCTSKIGLIRFFFYFCTPLIQTTTHKHCNIWNVHSNPQTERERTNTGSAAAWLPRTAEKYLLHAVPKDVPDYRYPTNIEIELFNRKKNETVSKLRQSLFFCAMLKRMANTLTPVDTPIARAWCASWVERDCSYILEVSGDIHWHTLITPSLSPHKSMRG